MGKQVHSLSCTISDNNGNKEKIVLHDFTIALRQRTDVTNMIPHLFILSQAQQTRHTDRNCYVAVAVADSLQVEGGPTFPDHGKLLQQFKLLTFTLETHVAWAFTPCRTFRSMSEDVLLHS